MTKEELNQEAEEYATRECCMTCKNINHFCKEKCECWTFAKKGIEFGYIKGNEQITKAKEIILTLINNFAYPISREDWTVEDEEIMDKAEQFIRGVEK